MNFNNPLEIALVVFLSILSIFLVERIIAGAFKTVIIGVIIALGFFTYTAYFHKDTIKKSNNKYNFTFYDFIDSTSFGKKFNYYKKEVKGDVVNDYFKARHDINK
jgi:energy-coupling factor transporter transmembrane protein EcfT